MGLHMTRDPDSGSGRPPGHRDWSRVPTRPGPHVDPLDATEDDPPDSGSGRFGRELTPVEHAHEIRLARVEAATVRIETAYEGRGALPDTEWARRADARIDDVAARIKVCEDERDRRTRWAPVIKWAKGVGAGGVVTALVWAVVKIGDAGAAREGAARDAQIMRALVDDVRQMQLDFAADHALLYQHLRPGTTSP